MPPRFHREKEVFSEVSHMGSDGVDGIKRLLTLKSEQLSKSFSKLAAGTRILSASDDAAGLAIADALKNDAVVYSAASRNDQDGQSLTAIQDGVYESLSNIGTRLQELSTQSANGTLSDAQRTSLNQEFQALSQEANRIVQATTFNGQQVFDGSSTAIQVGTDSSANSRINLTDPNLGGTVAALQPLSIATQAGAQSAIDQVSSFTANLSQSRGQLGAEQARLSVANNNIQSQRETSLAAESRIRDLDVAEETSRNLALRISQQANTSILAQASNLNANIVQRLLT